MKINHDLIYVSLLQILGWMHRKFKQTSNETQKDFSIGEWSSYTYILANRLVSLYESNFSFFFLYIFFLYQFWFFWYDLFRRNRIWPKIAITFHSGHVDGRHLPIEPFFIQEAKPQSISRFGNPETWFSLLISSDLQRGLSCSFPLAELVTLVSFSCHFIRHNRFLVPFPAKI